MGPLQGGEDPLRIPVVRLLPSLTARDHRPFGVTHVPFGHPEGRNPARMTTTSRRTAALEGRVLAAVRACRQ
jgi:hypothetical protein